MTMDFDLTHRMWEMSVEPRMARTDGRPPTADLHVSVGMPHILWVT